MRKKCREVVREKCEDRLEEEIALRTGLNTHRKLSEIARRALGKKRLVVDHSTCIC